MIEPYPLTRFGNLPAREQEVAEKNARTTLRITIRLSRALCALEQAAAADVRCGEQARLRVRR